MHDFSFSMIMRFFLFFLAFQLTVLGGWIWVFKPPNPKKTFWRWFVLAAFLHSSYFFLFAPPQVSPVVKIAIDYFILYPFFIYMLICMVLTPYFIIAAAVVLLFKGGGLLGARLFAKGDEKKPAPDEADLDRRGFLKTLTAGIVVPMAGCSFYGAYIGKEQSEIVVQELFFDDLPAGLDGFTIAQISDIHAGPFMSGFQLAGFTQIVTALKADIVVVTGDIINWGEAYVEQAVAALGDLRAGSGVYVVLGNHDFHCDVDNLCRRLEGVGIRVLRNTHQPVGRAGSDTPLYLAGIDDPRGSWYINKDFPLLDRALQGIPEGAFTVLLSHRPNIFECVPARNIQLTLAGHTHGGQIIVPAGPGEHGLTLAGMACRWDYGLYTEGRSYLYVNKGLGVVGPPVRLNCPREITKIVLRKKA